MKRFLLWSMLLYWGLNVAAPWIYYQIFGLVRIYGSISECPERYINEAALMVTIVLAVSGIIVAQIPIGNKKLELKKSLSAGWFYCAIVISVMPYIIGSINKGVSVYGLVTSGYSAGSLISYLKIFMNTTVFFYFYLFCVREESINIIYLVILYIAYTLFYSSRAGILTVAFALILRFLTVKLKNRINTKRMFLIFAAMFFLSISLYNFSTGKRSAATYKGKDLAKAIVGRCSNLELSGIALYQKEKKMWDSELFARKYSVDNQVKQIINSLIPGGIFEEDAYPNQYYRAIFGNSTEEACKEKYTSINMNLPVYLSLKYSAPVGIILAILLIVAFCMIVLLLSQATKFAPIITILTITEVIFIFDWVMMFNAMQKGILSCLMIYFLSKVKIKGLKIYFKKYKFNFRSKNHVGF